ncbi:MAG: Ig-like domain-containing protein [Gemmatimonadales bacterium]|nr:Ig-like domain-containing protein [Gemmatimonadales bacterium]
MRDVLFDSEHLGRVPPEQPVGDVVPRTPRRPDQRLRAGGVAPDRRPDAGCRRHHSWLDGRLGASLRLTVIPSLAVKVINTTPTLANGIEAYSSAASRDVGLGQHFHLQVSADFAPAVDVPITISHSDPTVAAHLGSSILRAGTLSTGRIAIQGLAEGSDLLQVTAAGHRPTSLRVDVAPGTFAIPGWPTSLTVGDSVLLRVWSMNPTGTSADYRTSPAVFGVGGDGSFRFTDIASSVFDACQPAGCSLRLSAGMVTQAFYLKAMTAGTGTLTVQSPGQYLTQTKSVPIAAPPFTTITLTPNPAGVAPGQTVQLTATPRNAAGDPVAGVAVTWTSGNPAVATVDGQGRVTGVTTGTAIITATSAGVSGQATINVGVPVIAPTPTTVTIPVQQGQSAQAQISIVNGGGGLLSGVTAGTFSNAFNGSAAPWVTATWNTTTAPAILTITAAPGHDIGPGVHQLRFDVAAPGASNSPFTFHTINITVIAAGVTPVNATIAPNPTTLAISVPAGQSRQGQISIGNTGTDPLTNLTAGSFSNYYNGEPAPWVTASFNTTTAPAILTISAAPGVSIPTGTHKLRFDVSSPGATNSPYTFYSINVTVTPEEPPPILAAAAKSNCVRRANLSVGCWGESSFGATAPSSGSFATIGAGFFHYCGIRPDQTLACWGYGSDLRTSPPSGTFQQLSAGSEHNCALRTDGTAACWGFLNDGRGSPPAGTYKKIGLGWYHGCAIRSDDTLVCWGRNDQGQATAPAGTFKDVSGGAFHSCAIRSDDTLVCFGAIPAPPTGTFRQVSGTMGGHSCAIRTDGTVACWGQNDRGQSSPPTGTFLQVSAAWLHSCGVRTNRTVACWGFNDTGALNIPPEYTSP